MVFINIHLDTSFNNNIINVTYTGYNVGKFPAKVSYMATKINYGVDTTTANLFEVGRWAIRPSKEYLPNNAFLNGFVTLPTTKDEVGYFKRGVTHIFVYFDIKYYCSVLKTTYLSYSARKLTWQKGNIDVSAIENK